MVFVKQIASNNMDVFIPFIPKILFRQYIEEKDMLFYGISTDGEAIGTVVLREGGDTAEILYMYLLPVHRRLGYMDKVFADIMFDLRDKGFSRLTMDYLPGEYPNIGRISSRFSFTENKSDRAYFRFDVEQIKKCKVMDYKPQGIVRLRALPEALRQELYRQVKNKGYDMRTIMADKAMLASVEEHSLVYMEREKPMGLVLVQDMKNLVIEDTTISFGRVFPHESAADIALIFVGSTQIKVPLYLISALCREILTEYQNNDVITGYFPDGHLTKLLEGTLGIKGMHEMTAVLSLDCLEKYDE